MSRPITVPRWAIYGLFFGLYLTARGYQSLDGDQAYRLPLLLHRQDPSLYADDPFVRAFDVFNPHRGYLALLDLASRPLGLSFGLFALFAATFALTCTGVVRLARAAWPGGGPWVGVVAVGLVLMARAGNVGTNHLFEATLLDRLIGFGLGWVALALAVEGETWRPSLLIGLAAVIHPSVGLQLGGLLMASWFAWAVAGRWTGQSWRGLVIGWAVLALAMIPGALPNMMQGLRLFDGFSPEEFRLVGVELQMAQHMVPSLWRKPQWLAWGAYMAVGGLALFSPRRSEALPGSDSEGRRARFILLFGVLLVGLGAAYGTVEVVRDLRVTVFQPFRMATIARGLALIALSGRCVTLWRRGDLSARARVLVLTAGLTGDWGFVVAVTAEIAASTAECLPRILGHIPLASILRRGGLLGSPPPQVERGLDGECRGGDWLALFVVVVLASGLVFLARHDLERGHRPILIALVASFVMSRVAHRFRTGWTTRRLAFAVAVCGGVPLAAAVAPAVVGPDHPIASALAARCRFGPIPTDDVERLALWARANTPTDCRFITPPGPKTFRLWSGRAVAFNRAASPYHAEGLKDWSDRFRAHVGFAGKTAEFVRSYLADRHGVESRYNRLTPEALAALAASQGADYVLAPSLGHGAGPLRLCRADGRYAIYRLDPSPAVARLR